MPASARRSAILELLQAAEEPVSAASLAARFSVSRQIIVGDVAILRAGGHAIEATPRGYLYSRPVSDDLLRTVACCHTSEGMEEELLIMVDNGCEVLDVIVEHPVYGQLSGALHLRSRYDVHRFVQRVFEEDAAPLSALTHGIHLHTLRCPDEAAFTRVCTALAGAGLLVEQQQGNAYSQDHPI